MSISNFRDFISMINETVELPILDVVIDDSGLVYDGKQAPLTKGRVERIKSKELIGGRQTTVYKVSRILGDDGKEYPAGIDKNGNIVVLTSRLDKQLRAVDSTGNPIPVLPEVRLKYKIKHDYYYQDPAYDYYNIIPIQPTGWVNIKVDLEVVKRVRRYARTLGTNTRGHKSFIDKLEEFQKFSSLKRDDVYIKRLKRGRIQKEMSCILLLRYIDEIKDFFNPSQSGFLLESFISGLIPNARTKEDNSPVDIKTPTDRYQLKFVDFKTEYIDIVRDLDGTLLDYYILAIKYVDKIEILVVNGTEISKRIESGSIVNFVTSGLKRPKPDPDKKKVEPVVREVGTQRFIMKNLNLISDETILDRFSIDLTNIDGRISNLGDSLKQNLDGLYKELSEFQYNVETITTGITEDGKVVKEQSEFDVFHLKAERNISNIGVKLKDLVSDINK